MNPAVRLPADGKIRTPVEIKLKPGWQFDPAQRVFISDHGEKFAPRGELPKNSKIVHKTPSLAAAARRPNAKLSGDERNLLRHFQVILPCDERPAKYVEPIRRWPCVEKATLPPEVSLPAVERLNG
jgi:hypothetical protein